MKVKEELDKLGLKYKSIELGYVELAESIAPDMKEQLKEVLLVSGLVVMEDKKSILAEKIRNIVVEIYYCSDELPRINFSDYMSEKLGHDYSYLSNIFSEVQGISLQQFIINSRIERVKELLIYDQLTLSEISFKLNFSSVAHLSNQFRKLTGMTPSSFRELKLKKTG